MSMSKMMLSLGLTLLILATFCLIGCQETGTSPTLSEEPSAEEGASEAEVEEEPSGAESNVSHLTFLSRIKESREEAYLVYILPHAENAMGYTGLAIFVSEEAEVPLDFELGKSYRATTNGIMTRSIPPQFSGRLLAADAADLPALEMSWSDFIVYKSLAAEAQLYDVRTSSEFASGHVPGAINLSLQEIEAGERGELDPKQPLFFYCRSGARSGTAAEILAEEGYLPVFNLGGILDYHGDVTTD